LAGEITIGIDREKGREPAEQNCDRYDVRN
jgi:hypothetical protein